MSILQRCTRTSVSAARRQTSQLSCYLPATTTAHVAAPMMRTCRSSANIRRAVHSAAARYPAAAAAASSAAAASFSVPSAAATAAPSAPPPHHSDPGVTVAAGTRTVLLDRSLPLSMGGGAALAAPLRLNYFDSAWEDLDGPERARAKPVVLIMPSMSHSALVVRGEAQRDQQQQSTDAASSASPSSAAPKGWWEIMVGRGPSFGIDLAQFRVLAASPLGTPYGSTSPLTPDPSSGEGRAYRAAFPLITPLDQARLYAYMLDYLNIARVHAVVGSSMGGMQALQFARLYPERYERVAALCTTPQTSSSTQALRSVQRAAVRSDPDFAGGNYADFADEGNAGPLHGMAIARMFGTICYRSREEFDLRFDPRPKADAVHAFQRQQQQQQQQHASSSSSSSSSTPASASPLSPALFDVESYLRHAAHTFTGRYDANCYLTLSQCMDLMDLGQQPHQPQLQQQQQKEAKEGQPHASSASSSSHASSPSSSPSPLSLEQACAPIPSSAQFLLLPVASDALIPASELEKLGSVLGSQKPGRAVHCERVHSLLGHDAFLKDAHTFGPRLRAFLDIGPKGQQPGHGVEQVRQYVNSLHDI